eukprot:TRINITY_DN8275_c0_g1_i2.p1 TRINITY_DN8275_c0_g1~~TRINITY_DN8275_c0_g1_i2.p1  ORF type:complete len:166 (-),score=24.78 TRINITY_DN8275_c0_g1_i2:201-698(-)
MSCRAFVISLFFQPHGDHRDLHYPLRRQRQMCIRDRYNIDPEVFEKNDFHIHVPDGATPKDGPSAGITMTTALISLLTSRSVKPALSMTGEITLRGKVTPVGGIKEKVIAAIRAGVKIIILPEENRKDLEDIPENIRKQIEFKFAERIDTVLDFVLEKKKKAGKQ